MELISREDAIDALCKAVDNKGMFEGEWLYTDEFVKVMQSLPTIDERKEGEWIDHSDEGYVECPFCGSLTTCEDNIDGLRYCFNCGARMKGE